MILKNKKQRIWFVVIIQSLALLFTAHFSNYTIAPTPRLYAFFLFFIGELYLVYIPYINNSRVYTGGASLNAKDHFNDVLRPSYVIIGSLLVAYTVFDFQPELFREFIYGKDYE